MLKKAYTILRYTITVLLLTFPLSLLMSQTNKPVKAFRETIWLQSNKNIYLAGENIIFRAALFETDSYKPSVLSHDIRIELLDENGNILYQNNYELKNSQLLSVIKIPDNIETGYCYLRAYTNWMRNYPDKDFTWLPLKIANPVSFNAFHPTDKNARVNIYPLPPEHDRNVSSIFVSDNKGNGIKAEGFVLSSPTDTVLKFSTDNTGWDLTEWRMTGSDNLKAFVEGFNPDKTEVGIIKEKQDEPYIILEENHDNFEIEISGLKASGYYKILAHRTSNWFYFKRVHTISNNVSFSIPRDSIPGGIVQFSLLDNKNNIIASRLWSDYNENESLANIEIPGKKHLINTSIDLKYSIIPNPGSDDPDNINILESAYNQGYLVNDYLPGLPGWNANYEIPRKQRAFDAWLAVSHYDDNTIKAFFAGSQEPCIPELEIYPDGDFHHPETRGTVLEGKVTDTQSGKGATMFSLALTILNDNSLYAMKTDINGMFTTTFPSCYGSRDYIINYAEKRDGNYMINIYSQFEDVGYLPDKGPVSFTEEDLSYLKNQIVIYRLKKIYSDNEKQVRQQNDSLPVNAMFYGEPDVKISVEDYIRLSNLREVIFEVVPNLVTRSHDKHRTLNIVSDYLYHSSYPSLILFDGIPVIEYDDILNLPPERIKSVEVVNKFYIHGNVIFSGIVNIESKNKDFGGLDLPSTAILTSIRIHEKQPDEHSIFKPASVNHNIPDLDDNSLWISGIDKARGNIKLYTGSRTGLHRVLIYGYDATGKWLYGSGDYSVAEY